MSSVTMHSNATAPSNIESLSEVNAQLKLTIKQYDMIDYVIMATNDSGKISLNNSKQVLNKGTIYKFKIQNENLDLEDFHIIKMHKRMGEKLEILNVENGIITITPRIHGTVVRNDDILGRLI